MLTRRNILPVALILTFLNLFLAYNFASAAHTSGRWPDMSFWLIFNHFAHYTPVATWAEITFIAFVDDHHATLTPEEPTSSNTLPFDQATEVPD